MNKRAIVITCEHAGNKVPEELIHLFAGQEDVLQSHRGWDPGSLEIGTTLAARLNAPLFYTLHSRLVVEVNRSQHSPQLFSEFTPDLPSETKEQLLETYYHPYRNSVIDFIRQQNQPVLHLSIHTFTPIWHGVERQVDVGLLFDPDRKEEQVWCEGLKTSLERNLPSYQIKHNEPYQGKDDGFATFLRTQFLSNQYMGIELEINQKYVGTPLLNHLAITIASVVSSSIA